MIIKPLAHIRAIEAGLFGAKAANLGELWHQGIPTKPGFAIADISDPMQGEMASAWLSMFQYMKPLAVRSSAVGEDGAGASFAGQHDTILNVWDVVTFFEAVENVLKSTEQSAAYRSDHGLPPIQMAVVVQEMVNAKAAGVMFTSDPVTGKADTVIEATSGLGDKLVSGEVTPDQYTLRVGDGIISRHLGGLNPVLKKDELHRLWSLGNAAKTFLSMGPLDIEWAIDQEDHIWLLQARPITTLTPETQGALV